jgi:phage/plasmid-like protein (TIGR03299 family)
VAAQKKSESDKVTADIDAALAENTATPDAEPSAEPAPEITSERGGLKSFTSREVPWMKLGPITEETHSAEKAAELGGLNFDVELLEAGFKSSTPPAVGKSAWRTVSTRRACVRTDTQQFFSYVSSTYTPIQYGDAFSFMDSIDPSYVAAGTLGGGRQAFMVVKLPETNHLELTIGKTIDPLDMFVVLRASHDLTRALEVSVLMLRGKCMNALTLSSFTQGAVQKWSVKHVGKDPVAKLAAATSTLQRSDAYMKSFIETANVLADIKLTTEEAEGVLRRVLPDKPKRDEQVTSIMRAWRDAPTGGFPDNGWGLVNGVSDYFEWGRNEGTRTEQSRFTGALTGATHRFTNRTAQLLLARRR